MLLPTYPVFSHTAKEDFDFSIIFGGCFDKDIVSLKINNSIIFDHIRVDNRNNKLKGNLSLTQAKRKISLFYNGQKKFKNYISYNYFLTLDVTVNDKVEQFKIDLRKGKVIVIEHCIDPNYQQSKKKLSFEQVQEEVIFI